MANKLEEWIKNSENEETGVMNLLQEFGIVSDNCIHAKDCGNDLKAIRWLAVNAGLLNDL
jgi:hypothetical protein